MRKRIKPGYILTVIIIVNILLLLPLGLYPYPEIFIYPYLKNLGFVPYVDIIDQHFPGLFFLPINFASLGLKSELDARIVQLSLVVINQLLIFYYFKISLKDYKYKYLWANVLLLVWSAVTDGNLLWLDNFLATLILTSIVLLQKSEKKCLYIAFFLLGVAVVLKQTSILFILASLVLLYSRFKTYELAKFNAISLAPLLLSLLYINTQGALNQFLFWTFSFNSNIYGQMALKYPTQLQVLIFAPIIMLAAYSSIMLLTAKKVILPPIFFLISLIFIFPRFEPVHLTLSIILAIIVIVNYFQKSNYFYAVVALLLIVGLAGYVKSARHSRVSHPAGYTQVVTELKKLTVAGDTIYAYSVDATIHPDTETIPPKPYFIHLPWYLVLLEDELLVNLKNNPPEFVVRNPNATLDGNPIRNSMLTIEDHINKNYSQVFENDYAQILKLNE